MEQDRHEYHMRQLFYIPSRFDHLWRSENSSGDSTVEIKLPQCTKLETLG